ncbi:hypothetical protein [Desertibacillus haloalkaliphilus]|uniref:hypothetical protein n=1 Tax=Desertibacillus haloalkaliphilus TaxID=1328930 RepID=UPI001C259B1E|nr:hypothetical protein [Desertibacillus haloalkaliphilus]MBU8907786.1 hypothetical protein [Desertibacillus haloalkaliphilus]
MHTKQTVKYRCEQYPSGNCYYYKQEIITHDSWNNLDSLSWSRPRPISKRTFFQREKQGYRVEYKFINKQPATVHSISSDFR